MADARPLSLDDLERCGATRFGRSVVRVELRLADGRTAVFDLPDESEVRHDAETMEESVPLTGQMRQLLEAFKKSPKPLTRKCAATAIGNKNTKGRIGESFRRLVSEGLLFTSGGYYTDDPKKMQKT